MTAARAGGDSTPVLQYRSNYIAWARVLQKDYEQLRRDVEHNRQTILDRYGATNPAEFFAVATEYFFEMPRQLQQQHLDLYNELKLFYQQDPTLL